MNKLYIERQDKLRKAAQSTKATIATTMTVEELMQLPLPIADKETVGYLAHCMIDTFMKNSYL